MLYYTAGDFVHKTHCTFLWQYYLLIRLTGSRLEEMQTCSKCKYKLYLCSCSSFTDHDYSGKHAEESNDLKVYSEKFKNKKIILAPEKKEKKESLYGDDSEDEQPPRKPKRLGMTCTVLFFCAHFMFFFFLFRSQFRSARSIYYFTLIWLPLLG